MWKLMQLLGLDGSEGYEGNDDYPEEDFSPRKQQRQRSSRQKGGASLGGEERSPFSVPRLVLFKGVPSDDVKRRLSDALKDGAIVLLDLHALSQRDFDEQGRPFITFMGGVAFARGGHMEPLESEMYLVVPREGMFQEWVEEGQLNDGTFDGQGR
ncbi:MAG: cell division protein SepF [Fretibacterium sp.]|nr:cell division protein SepF [Fretibacterium sp.]